MGGMSSQKLPPPSIPPQMPNGRSNEKPMMHPVNGRTTIFAKPTNVAPIKPPTSSTLANLASVENVDEILQLMTRKRDLLDTIPPTPRNELTEIQLSRAPIYAEMLAPIPRKSWQFFFLIF